MTIKHYWLTLFGCALCFIWVGMLAGISFLETPVKFQAPSLTLPVGLDVGRQVFGVFDKVQLVLTLIVVALVAIMYRRLGKPLITGLAVVILLQYSQSLWLLPALDARVELILNAQTPPSSQLHLLFIVIEALKMMILGYCGYRFTRLGLL